MSSRIRCYLIEKQYGLIFNIDDIRLLREKYRIIGCFTGSSVAFPRQNNELSIPLELSIEECFVLLNQKLIQLFELKTFSPITDQNRLTYLKHLELDCQQQMINSINSRINDMLSKRQFILENSQMLSTIEQDEEEEEESVNNLLTKFDSTFVQILNTNNSWLNCQQSLTIKEKLILLNEFKNRNKKSSLDPHTHTLVEIPIESYRQHELIPILDILSDLSLINNNDKKLRCHVFQDLWIKGYFISNGQKFGGDFLVYTNDPHICHSTFIIHCIQRTTTANQIPLISLIAKGRLASNVNKTSVIATYKQSITIDDDEKIDYLSINWTGI
ncbi:unnamed protein product [Didymodactylos carnosus]|uniref:tRNA-splicing endonuclease subunit Sen34 n=1 Tax=Didymodactylos carnosus TaxID=1234261 RepID=A0A814G515_9BILA|nr:unnamed protein product [Didymodactylos carnosus]CAF3761149.1 unnamed protein product [Didymodactylos carnosus]